jgi:hypothetical protein
MTPDERHFMGLNPNREGATKGGSLHWNGDNVPDLSAGSLRKKTKTSEDSIILKIIQQQTDGCFLATHRIRMFTFTRESPPIQIHVWRTE